MESSSFDINHKNEISPGNAESRILLSDSGKTSITYKVNLHGKWVVVKRIKKEFVGNTIVEGLFGKEFETGFALDHPHIVKYLNTGSDSEGIYIVTEFVDGKTLRQHFEDGTGFSQQQISKIVSQLFEAVSYLHKKNVFHLDIKPENIIVSDKTGNIKLIDFGFSYSDGRIPISSGTKKYSSKLQITNPEKINYSNDLYSIGVVLIELFTGSTEPEKANQLPVPFRKIAKSFVQEKNNIELEEAFKMLSEKSNRVWIYFLLLAAFAVATYLMWPHKSQTEKVVANEKPVETKWQSLPQMPKGRSDGGLVQYNSRIFYLSGMGADGGLPTYEVYEFNTSANQYTEKKKIGTARAEMGAVLLDGKIYTFGGWIGNAATDTCEVYSVEKNQWEYLPPLPKKLTSVNACVWKDRIFIIGSTLDVTNTYFYEYNPSEKKYIQKTVFNNSRMNSCLVTANNLIYAIGGNSYKNDSYYIHNDVDVYNPVTDQWERKTSLPAGITRGSAVAFRNEIHYLGGTSKSNPVTDRDALNTHYIYDVTTDTWKNGESLPFPVWGNQCTIVNDKMYCFGGYEILPNATGKVNYLQLLSADTLKP